MSRAAIGAARRPVRAAAPPPAAGAPGASARSRLSVVDRRALVERSRRRRARTLLLLSATTVAMSLGVVVGAQALVASQQITLDAARQQLAQSVAEDQQLQFRRSQLEAPARILSLAETKLHMVAPVQVTYLAPVATGPTVADRHPQRR